MTNLSFYFTTVFISLKGVKCDFSKSPVDYFISRECKYLSVHPKNPNVHEFYFQENVCRLLLHIAASWQKTQIVVLVLAIACNI